MLALVFCLLAADRPTPQEFGAVADGTTDDTAAIQATIDAGRGGLTLPPGRYRLTETIVVDLAAVGPVALVGQPGAELIMDGPGPAIRLVGTHEGTAFPKSVRPGVWARERMPTVSGVAVRGTHPEADGFELVRTMQATLAGAHVRNCRHAIALRDRNRNVVIDRAHLYENDGAGVLLDDVNLHQILIGDSHISYCLGGGVVVRRGEVRNLHIGNCDLEQNMPTDPDDPRTAESLAANLWVDLTPADDADDPPAPGTSRNYRNTLAELTVTGCTLQHSGKARRGANIRIFGRANYPANMIAITGNVLSDASRNLDFDYVSGATVTGNTFFTAKPVDVDVRRSRRLTFAGNHFDPRFYEGAREQTGGLRFADCDDIALSALQIASVRSPSGAIALTDCNRVAITGCVVRDCAAGISLTRVTDSALTGNILSEIDGGAITETDCVNVRRTGNVTP